MTEKNIVIVALIVFAIWVLVRLPIIRESFFNIIPTEIIDPEYQYPLVADYDITNLPLQPQQYPKLYERVGEADRNCQTVQMKDVLDWIARDEPRIIHECVLRFDPSVDITNPYHATRVLRLIMINLPTFSPQSAQKYLPVLSRCFPKQTQV